MPLYQGSGWETKFARCWKVGITWIPKPMYCDADTIVRLLLVLLKPQFSIPGRCDRRLYSLYSIAVLCACLVGSDFGPGFMLSIH